MPDFFSSHRELTIAEIVTLTGAKPAPGMPLDGRITDIAPLDRARSSDITFLDNAKYLDALATTRAGACLLAPRFAGRAPHGLVTLVTSEPYRAFVAVARALFPSALRPSSLFGLSGHSADARVHERCRMLVITKEAFDDLLFLHKDLAYEVLWNCVRILSARLRETNEKLTMLTTSGKF